MKFSFMNYEMRFFFVLLIQRILLLVQWKKRIPRDSWAQVHSSLSLTFLGFNHLRRTGENGFRWSNFGDDEPEEAIVEGEREQHEEREEEESHSSEDIQWTSSSRELQLAEALWQQRSPQSSLCRSWLVRRRRRHHLSQGKTTTLVDLNFFDSATSPSKRLVL